MAIVTTRGVSCFYYESLNKKKSQSTVWCCTKTALKPRKKNDKNITKKHPQTLRISTYFWIPINLNVTEFKAKVIHKNLIFKNKTKDCIKLITSLT